MQVRRIDDPDCKGFWTAVSLWNSRGGMRHTSYRDDREAEQQYLDELPSAPAPVAEPQAKEEALPEVKTWFNHAGDGTHTVGGVGKIDGRQRKRCRARGTPAERPEVPSALYTGRGSECLRTCTGSDRVVPLLVYLGQ